MIDGDLSRNYPAPWHTDFDTHANDKSSFAEKFVSANIVGATEILDRRVIFAGQE
jgi:hypothetical protein